MIDQSASIFLSIYSHFARRQLFSLVGGTHAMTFHSRTTPHSGPIASSAKFRKDTKECRESMNCSVLTLLLRLLFLLSCVDNSHGVVLDVIRPSYVSFGYYARQHIKVTLERTPHTTRTTNKSSFIPQSINNRADTLFRWIFASIAKSFRVFSIYYYHLLLLHIGQWRTQ